MEIKRDIYLNQLVNARQNGFIKVITGPRRCGKSYLLDPGIVLQDILICKTCGVTYGNGTRKELEEAGADYIIDEIADLLTVNL